MKAVAGLLLSASVLASCGGSDGTRVRSAIEGTWRGELQQGVLSCSDGSVIGAGTGTIAWRASMTVTGSDEAGSPVRAVDGSCILAGTRDATGFTAQAVSGCPQGMVSLRFTLLAHDKAALGQTYAMELMPIGIGGLQCKISPSGTVARDPAG